MKNFKSRIAIFVVNFVLIFVVSAILVSCGSSGQTTTTTNVTILEETFEEEFTLTTVPVVEFVPTTTTITPRSIITPDNLLIPDNELETTNTIFTCYKRLRVEYFSAASDIKFSWSNCENSNSVSNNVHSEINLELVEIIKDQLCESFKDCEILGNGHFIHHIQFTEVLSRKRYTFSYTFNGGSGISYNVKTEPSEQRANSARDIKTRMVFSKVRNAICSSKKAADKCPADKIFEKSFVAEFTEEKLRTIGGIENVD